MDYLSAFRYWLFDDGFRIYAAFRIKQGKTTYAFNLHRTRWQCFWDNILQRRKYRNIRYETNILYDMSFEWDEDSMIAELHSYFDKK